MESISVISNQRQRECEGYSRWLEKRIALLSKLNWLTVLVPSLLGIVAGSVFFAGAEYQKLTGGLALLAAILAATHKGLNCDAYQADCRRLLMEYRALANAYRTLGEIEHKEQDAALLKLETKLEELARSDCISKLKPNKTRNKMEGSVEPPIR